MLQRLCIHLALIFCVYLSIATLWKIPIRERGDLPLEDLHLPRRTTAQACGFPGNSDTYGLGIRLGVYLQWVSALISKQFLVASNAEVLRELIDVNTIFSLAIFIATVLWSSEYVAPVDSTVHGVEILIMLHIYFGNTYIISYEHLLRSNNGRGLTFFGITATIFITAGMSCYAIYYWFYALDILPGTGCGNFAFLFAKVGIYGPARTFFKIASVINMLIWGSGFLLLAGWAIPYLLLGLIRMLYYSTKHAIQILMKWLSGSEAEVSAPWRDTNKGHARYVVGVYMGMLGAPKGERELQAGWRKYEIDQENFFTAKMKKENPIV